MKILANDGISDLGKKLLEEAGFTVITEKVEQENLIAETNVQNIEMILVQHRIMVRWEDCLFHQMNLETAYSM